MSYIDFDKKTKGVLKVKLLKDLTFFIRFFFREVEGNKFLLSEHHKKISAHLTDIYTKKYNNLIINIPPRHSKTTMSCYFTAWSLAKNPKSLFLYISASDKLANDNSRIVRSIITHPAYKELFGVEISVDTTAKNHWRTNAGGGITTATVNGQITGFGAGAIDDHDHFQGAIIIDDPNKPKAEKSNILSTEPNDRFTDTIRSRRNGKNTPIIVIQQRTFPDDLSGFLLNGGGAMDFKHLCMPVVTDNVPLWSDKMDLDEIESIRKGQETSHIFESQYMQNPQPPEGLFFHLQDLQTFAMSELNEANCIRINSIDPADKGTDSYCDIYSYYDNDKVYIVDVIFNSGLGLGVNEKASIAKINDHNSDFCVIEINKEGGAYINNLKRSCKTTRFYPIFNSINKMQRIIVQEQFIKDTFVFRSDYGKGSDYDNFMHQLTHTYRDGTSRHDDAADNCSLLAKFIREKMIRGSIYANSGKKI